VVREISLCPFCGLGWFKALGVCGAFRIVRGYCVTVIGVGAFLAVRKNTRLFKGAVEDCGSLVRGGVPLAGRRWTNSLFRPRSPA
jgi:hypothetical protein